jgi:hypothetical protein
VNEAELREMMAARKPSPHFAGDAAKGLVCYGCAHSAAGEPPPGGPSGERPCMACVRNPDRPWESEREFAAILVDDQGNARAFDSFLGTAYNGMPMVHHPMDRYVTLDSRDQEDWLERNPGYGATITFDADGNPQVVES